jgi:hypothetical protein
VKKKEKGKVYEKGISLPPIPPKPILKRRKKEK